MIMQVRIHCAECKDFDLCVTCFSNGNASREHNPQTHPYQVIEQHSVPIFNDDWGADEEAMLLEGAETYGLGSWADIADHIGGFRDKKQVEDHYIQTYINSSRFPLPEHASPANRDLIEQWPREKFQAKKRQRIETCKEAAKSAPPAPPKQKPTSSQPSCHEVQGFMPGRLEFETEHLNEAEEAVQHMQFEPGEGIDPRTGELEPEMVLKMTVMDIYNSRLVARVERKRFIFEHELLEYRRNMASEKKKTKEEKDLFNKSKPLARLMRKTDFDQFTHDLEYELNLRQAIAQLQDWRHMQIGDLKSGEKYEIEKSQRAQKFAAQNSYDRFAANRPAKTPNSTEPVSVVSALTGPDLPLQAPNGLHTPPPSTSSQSSAEKNKAVPNGNGIANGAQIQMSHRPKFSMPPLSNVSPVKLNNDNAPDLHLLTPDERDLCGQLRIMPKSYMAIKENMLREAARQGGSLKKKVAKENCRIDSAKGGRLFDFFVHCGWIGKA